MSDVQLSVIFCLTYSANNHSELLSLPAAMMEQLKPRSDYLNLGISLLYLFIRLGRNYSFDYRSCFKRVSLKGRELVPLCCLDAGIFLGDRCRKAHLSCLSGKNCHFCEYVVLF